MDDAYGRNGSEIDIDYYTRDEWLEIFAIIGVKLIEEDIIGDEEITNINNEQQEFIEQRSNELKAKYPHKAMMFDAYIQSQQVECDALEYDITGVTMLLQSIR